MSGAASAFRRALDRAVTLGWIGRGCGLVAAWSATAAILVAALAALDVVSGCRFGLAIPPGRWRAVGIASVAAVVAAVMRRGARPPSRLSVALATEHRRPSLGEMLSRAVEFLPARDEPSGCREDPDAATTRALERLAVEQAAAAHGPLVIPGGGRDAAWIVVGAALPAALWLSCFLLPGSWAGALRGQVGLPAPTGRPVAVSATGARAETSSETGPETGPETASRSSPAVRQAAERLRATAAVARSLAEILATLFAAEPGVRADSLPRPRRGELETLAAIQRQCLAAIGAARDAVRASAPTAPAGLVSGALEELERIDGPEAFAAAEDIAANRLARAADAVAGMSLALERAAAALGPAETRAGAGADPWPAHAAAVIARIAATHRDSSGGAAAAEADLAQGAAAAPDGAARPGRADDAATQAATSGGRSSISKADGAAGRGGGPGQGTPPAVATPRAGADDAVRADRDDSAAAGREGSAIGDVWRLLPGENRPDSARGGVGLAPPAYAPAVDAYYRLLLERLSEPSRSRPAAGATPPPTRADE